jgi:hypothetical protein
MRIFRKILIALSLVWSIAMKKEEWQSQPWFKPVKGAQRDLIEEVGGLARAAKLLGRSAQHVGRYNNWNDPDLMTHWEIIVLEADLGRPIVSRAMAMMTGASVLDPSSETRGRDCLHAGSAKLMAEHAEFFIAFSEAASDGHFSDREMLELLPKVQDVSRSAVSLERKIHRKLAKAVAKGGDE